MGYNSGIKVIKKTLFVFVIILVSSLVVFSSCEKEEDDNDKNNAKPEQLKGSFWEFDGDEYQNGDEEVHKFGFYFLTDTKVLLGVNYHEEKTIYYERGNGMVYRRNNNIDKWNYCR